MKSKLGLTAGILDVILSAVSFAYAIILTLCVGMSLIISVFVLPAVIVSLLFFLLTSIAFIASAAYIVTGIAGIVCYCAKTKISKIVNLCSLIVSIVYLAASSLSVLFAVMMMTDAEGAASTLLYSVPVFLSVALAIANIFVNAVNLKRNGLRMRSVPVQDI